MRKSEKFHLKVGMIEAIQYLREDNISSVQNFMELDKTTFRKFRYQESLNEYGLVIRKENGLHDLHILERGEYIVREITGEFTVYPESVFLKMYERSEKNESCE